MLPSGWPSELVIALVVAVWAVAVAIVTRRDPRWSHLRLKGWGMRRLPVRITVRQLMVLMVPLAVVFWLVHAILRIPQDRSRADLHGLLASLGTAEAEDFAERAEACRRLSKARTPWDGPSEWDEVLKLCPYEHDPTCARSWEEQAEVWEDAARRSLRAAEWHRSRQRYYGVW